MSIPLHWKQTKTKEWTADATVGQDGWCSGTWVCIYIYMYQLAPFVSLPPMVQIISVIAFMVISALLEMQKLCRGPSLLLLRTHTELCELNTLTQLYSLIHKCNLKGEQRTNRPCPGIMSLSGPVLLLCDSVMLTQFKQVWTQFYSCFFPQVA